MVTKSKKNCELNKTGVEWNMNDGGRLLFLDLKNHGAGNGDVRSVFLLFYSHNYIGLRVWCQTVLA
jgi:hypothetical protein